jgi:hypothetical protein
VAHTQYGKLEAALTKQLPPFKHVIVLHADVQTEQLRPEQPLGHVHEYKRSASFSDVQVPPFMHGEKLQAFSKN